MKLDREYLAGVVEAYENAFGNTSEAARRLGIARTTFQTQYAAAERLGLTGNVLYGKALEGMEFAEVSTQVDANGKPQKEWTKQRPEGGEILTKEQLQPIGQRLRGISTLIDGEGRMIAQWYKTEREAQATADYMAMVKAELSDMPKLPLVPDHIAAMPDLLAVYPIVDHHLGMYSWAKETGQNYDLDIAERVLLGTMDKLIAKAPAADTALLLVLGDFFHMDNSINRTEKSGNPLDGDGRYSKVLQVGIKLLKTAVLRALNKHWKVKVRVMRGNHDDRGALVLALVLAEAFANNPRVEVETDPSLFFFMEWGLNMIGAHHGHTVKPAAFPGKMAAIKPEMWGRTKFRYSWSGHVHRTESGPRGLEVDGAEYEIFEASTARDAWTAENGFTSNRSMYCIVLDKDGDIDRFRSYIKGE